MSSKRDSATGRDRAPGQPTTSGAPLHVPFSHRPGPPPESSLGSDATLPRLGAVAGVAGILLQVAMDQAHPHRAQPNDSVARAFSRAGLLTAVVASASSPSRWPLTVWLSAAR